MKEGNKFGAHRVIEPKGVLPQPAWKIDNTMEIYDNEILIDVDTLNVDAASFTQIEEAEGGDVKKMAAPQPRHHREARQAPQPRHRFRRHAARHGQGRSAPSSRTATSRSATASPPSSRCR